MPVLNQYKQAALYLLLAFCGLPVFAEAPLKEEPSEHQVKAAYLYHFSKFVQWPDTVFSDDSSAVCIMIAGKDPFKSVLDQTVASKTLNNHRFKIKRASISDTVENVHILFVGGNKLKPAKEILDKVQGQPVLTVSDIPGFAREGGCINFILQQNRILFEINADACQRAGLTISSKLLRLAIIVEGKH